MQRHRVLTVTATHCVLMSERMRQMQQQISFVTLGVSELSRSRRFYVEGFGWSPVFENEEIIFYQMAGFVLGTFLNPYFSYRGVFGRQSLRRLVEWVKRTAVVG